MPVICPDLADTFLPHKCLNLTNMPFCSKILTHLFWYFIYLHAIRHTPFVRSFLIYVILRGFYATKKWCLSSCWLLVKKTPRSKVAVDKRNMTSDLVYSIRRQGVTRLERFYQYVILGQNNHCCVTLPWKKKKRKKKKTGGADSPIFPPFFFFKSCTVLFLFPAANRSLIWWLNISILSQ